MSVRQQHVSVEDVAQQHSGWELAQALRLKVEQHPEQGARGQMLNALGMLISAGGAWLMRGSFEGKESQENECH